VIHAKQGRKKIGATRRFGCEAGNAHARNEAKMSAVILQLAEPLMKQNGTTAERAEGLLMLTNRTRQQAPFRARPSSIEDITDGVEGNDGGFSISSPITPSDQRVAGCRLWWALHFDVQVVGVVQETIDGQPVDDLHGPVLTDLYGTIEGVAAIRDEGHAKDQPVERLVFIAVVVEL
jgi:hypothetical protein